MNLVTFRNSHVEGLFLVAANIKVPPFRLESNGFNSDLNDLFAFRFVSKQ